MVNLKKQVQHTGAAQIQVQRMKAVLLPFPEVTASMEVVTTIWVASVTFGLLQKPIPPAGGTGSCITIVQKCTGSAIISITGFLSVVSGIDCFIPGHTGFFVYYLVI